MNIEECLRAGKLTEARAMLIDQVKADPVDTGKRTLLLHVLALLGQWDKAQHHLGLIAIQDPARQAAVRTYQDILAAEKERARLLQAYQMPACLPGQTAYSDLYQAYLHALRDCMHGFARSLLHEIDALRPEIRGSIGDEAFEWFAETDARLFGFLEAFVHGRYVWIPFEAIREITLRQPRTTTDLIWMPAQLSTWQGMDLHCVLPVLYPESCTHADEFTRLGRMTRWSSLGEGLARAWGQHVYQAGAQEVALLDIRGIRFQPPGGH